MGQDMTKGNPLSLIFKFTLPLLLGNVFQQFYSIADTYIVSQTLGVNAFAAVGATGSINFLILGLAIGLTAGLSVLTAQRYGKRDFEGLRKNLAASVIISSAATVILTLFSVLFARQILEIMKTPANLIDDAYAYIVVLFAGIGATVLFNLISNVLRAIGDSKTPLKILALSTVINIVLSYFFILTFQMGVEGAALATIIAQIISSVLCLIYIWKKVPTLRIYKEDWKVSKKELVRHLQVGLPMGFQSSIIAIGSMTIQVTLNGLGDSAVAAMTASDKINGIATMPLNSFGITMATYAAQNYGAGKMDRIWKGVEQITRVVLVYSFVMGAALVLFGRQFASAFIGTTDIEILNHTHTYFLTNATFYFLLALLFILRYTLQGLGQSTAPTAAGIMELLSRVLSALFLAAPLGFAGVTIANPLAWGGALIPLVASYTVTKKRLTREAAGIVEEEEAIANPFFRFLYSFAR